MGVIVLHLFLKWQCVLSGYFERAILIKTLMLSSLCLVHLKFIFIYFLQNSRTSLKEGNFKRNYPLMWALHIPSIYSSNRQWFVSIHIKLLLCKMSECECSSNFALPCLNSFTLFPWKSQEVSLLRNLCKGLGRKSLKEYKCCSKFIK